MLEWLLLQALSPMVAALATTWGLGIACIAVWFLAPAWLPINRSHLMWAGIALLGCGTFYAWAFKAGEHHMTQLIAAKDRAAIERVEKSLKEVNDCNGGADWDVVTGRCKTQ